MNTHPFFLLFFWFGFGDQLANMSVPPEHTVLVKRLGSDNFKEREEATNKLIDLMPKSMRAVELAKKDGDLEVSRRAERIINAYNTSRYKAAWDGRYDELPSYWSLPEEIEINGKKCGWSKEDIKEGLKKYVEEVDNSDGEKNRAAEIQATDHLIRKMLDEGVPPEQIRKLLNRMKEINIAYNGYEGPWGFSGPEG